MTPVGLTDTSSSLFNYLHTLAAKSPTATNTASQTAPAATTTLATTNGESAPVEGAAGGRHHHRHGGGNGIFQQIQSAVTSALQSAKSDGSADANKTVEDAIAQVLQSNGGALTQAATGAPNATGNPSDPDNDGDVHAAGQGPASNSARQAFFSLLQANGIDPQQFRNDFLAAVKDAQGGQVNPQTALQSFPAGTTIDAVS